MEEKSTALNAKDAAIRVMELESPNDVLAFIEGDNRPTVKNAADRRLRELGHPGLEPKQGQSGPITEEAGDFKEGVQGKKDVVTCEDVIQKMRSEGKKI